MNIASGHFTLTDEQRRFKEMLLAYPRLLPYWDFDKREVDKPGLTKAMRVMSSGESTLALFFLGVWLNDDAQSVSVVEVAGLDDSERKSIIDWLATPYFP